MAAYPCESCGQTVERYPSQVKRHGGRVFCSRACAAQRQQRTGATAPCAWCGAPAYRKPSEVRAHVFCSRTCANRFHSEALLKSPELRGLGATSVACAECGAAFVVKPHRVGKARFCSKVCYYRNRAGRATASPDIDRTGANNPNYRGTNNRTTARLTAARLHEPVCMVCGWDVSVDTHHVTPRREGGTNDAENLAVLCPNHHRMAHLSLLPREDLRRTVRAAIAARSDRPRPSGQRSPPRRGSAAPAP